DIGAQESKENLITTSKSTAYVTQLPSHLGRAQYRPSR
ncbi:unnamed protein product, partial [Adineta steineri]